MVAAEASTSEVWRRRLRSWGLNGTATPAPGSRWRSPRASSDGFAPRSSRPARPVSAPSPGCTRSDDRRLLAASTDGVGTKLILARARGRLADCGRDLAAHCINDVATTGATPLVLLDYVAANAIDLDQVAELVEGAAEVCRAAGVALVGGETAELPGIYRDGELDFAGTCVGIVDRDDLVDGSTVAAGDAVIGFASAGVHANGFTLVRRVLELEDYDGPDLLAPTRLYLDEARALRGRAKAFAHVTGGGIVGNLGRVVPDGLRAEIDWDAWHAAAGVRLARPARRRGGDAPRVQPRDRLVRRRRRARATARLVIGRIA